MSISQTYNADCLPAMREMPDNTFDLAVVDPPYGAGFSEGGGCQGWFAKYHQPAENRGGWNRFGQRFDRYKYASTTFTAAEEQTNAEERKGAALYSRDQKSKIVLSEQAINGQRDTQKNHIVGRRAGTRIF